MDCTNKDPQNVGFNCRKQGLYVLTLFGIEVFPGTSLKLTESTAPDAVFAGAQYIWSSTKKFNLLYKAVYKYK